MMMTIRENPLYQRSSVVQFFLVFEQLNNSLNRRLFLVYSALTQVTPIFPHTIFSETTDVRIDEIARMLAYG